MESEGIVVEHPAAIESARQLRQEIRDNDPLTPSEVDRLTRARWEIDPQCDKCHLQVERVEDAMLLNNVIGPNGKNDNQALVHNACFLDTLSDLARLANRLPRLGRIPMGRRF